MYTELQIINERPKPFEFYTAEELWTDEHTSTQMLKFHLNGEVDISSYNTVLIDQAVEWMKQHFEISPGKTVIDFGCGPGLYTLRLACTEARVIGVDFSSRSIAYAESKASEKKLNIDYVHLDYMEYESEEQADLILMIMRDFGALSPEQRQLMLRKFAGILKPGGAVLLDIDSLAAFSQREECATYAPQLLDGFWSAGPYYGFQNTSKYEEEKVVLDKYVIIEPNRQRTIYNWMQGFSPESLTMECEADGLIIESIHGSIAGDDYDSEGSSFAVVLRRT